MVKLKYVEFGIKNTVKFDELNSKLHNWLDYLHNKNIPFSLTFKGRKY